MVWGGRGLSWFERRSLLLGQFYMLKKAKNAQKLKYYIITGPKLGGGGVRGASAKSQRITFFKPPFIENSTKIVQRRVVLLE